MTIEEAKIFLLGNDYVATEEEANSMIEEIKSKPYAPEMGISEDLYQILIE